MKKDVFAFIVILVAAGTVRALENPVLGELQQLSESERRDVLAHILPKDDACGSVTRTFYQGARSEGSEAGAVFWNIACANGRSYVVMIRPDRSSMVLDCTVYEAKLGLHCFTTFEDLSKELRPTRPAPLKEIPPSKLRP